MALALFDLDNTLIGGDSDHSWGEFLVRQGVVDGDHYRAKNDQFYRDYLAGCLDINAYLELALAPLAAHPKAQLDQLHRQFMDEVIEPLLLPKAQALIERHRAAGDRLLVITATNRFVVEPICARLGLTELLATEPELIDGRYTGRVSGVPTFQGGKVTRFNDWLVQQGISATTASYFYSDSINDLPLLEQVSSPVAVDPCDKLRHCAQQRGWPIISLRD
ncbi:HAD family hydrolase [Gammaproteobacteria bacterium LSUCC0057]|uniref:Histidinol-phosphatase n=1 Tax=Gammaproteobacteria bacterium LSUCC0057 TaxID=2559237 RepID=A0A4Y8UJ54_9GAMM|nr:HAD family hydrolase [Gammaproteobacteria bacterium LSUCC0057]